AGWLVLLWRAPRPWPWSRLLAIIASVWVILAFSIYLQAHERFGQGLVHEDRSITNRLVIWKQARRMMVDAPGGLGIRNSGNAYGQWYQPLDQHELYRTLVNSHLTWLVEVGWPLRFLYVFGWVTAVVLCWPWHGRKWFSIPLGI